MQTKERTTEKKEYRAIINDLDESVNPVSQKQKEYNKRKHVGSNAIPKKKKRKK